MCLTTFSLYFAICMIFSLVLVRITPYHRVPIAPRGYPRIGGVIPLREMLLVTPLSYLLWSYLMRNKQKNRWTLLWQSIGAMFITGFIIHSIFGVKSKLGNVLGIHAAPDGTGFAPYS